MQLYHILNSGFVRTEIIIKIEDYIYYLQSAQACEATEHSFSEIADRVFSQIQALQETESYKSRFLESCQVIKGQVTVNNKKKKTR